MNNKKTGMQFEKFMCKELARRGWWAHFMSPGPGGAQPFDIIAIRGSHILAIDCKTCVTKTFPYSRIEDNQRLAFDALMDKSDSRRIKSGFAISYGDRIVFLPYEQVITDEKNGKKSYCLEGRNDMFG